MIPPEVRGQKPQSCPKGTGGVPTVSAPWKPRAPRCRRPQCGSCGSCRTACNDVQGTIRRWAECQWRWAPWGRDRKTGDRPSSGPHAGSISNADSGFDEPSPVQNREWCYYNAYTEKPDRAYRCSANNLSSWESNSNKQGEKTGNRRIKSDPPKGTDRYLQENRAL